MRSASNRQTRDSDMTTNTAFVFYATRLHRGRSLAHVRNPDRIPFPFV
jgi:hypothetical protein